MASILDKLKSPRFWIMYFSCIYTQLLPAIQIGAHFDSWSTFNACLHVIISNPDFVVTCITIFLSLLFDIKKKSDKI